GTWKASSTLLDASTLAGKDRTKGGFPAGTTIVLTGRIASVCGASCRTQAASHRKDNASGIRAEPYRGLPVPVRSGAHVRTESRRPADLPISLEPGGFAVIGRGIGGSIIRASSGEHGTKQVFSSKLRRHSHSRLSTRRRSSRQPRSSVLGRYSVRLIRVPER